MAARKGLTRYSHARRSRAIPNRPGTVRRALASLFASAQSPASQAESEQIDLAALTLVPADLPVSGFGFVDGRLINFDPLSDALAEDIAEIADLRGTSAEIDALIPFLEAIGWRRQYESLLARPRSASSDRFRRTVSSFVIEYTNSDSAAIDYVLLQNASSEAGHVEVPGTYTVGDVSRIARENGRDPETREEFWALDLVFRRGQYIAGVTIVDFVGEEPTVAEIEPLARILQARLDAATPSTTPTPSQIVLRPTAPEGTNIGYVAEYYTRRDGNVIPLFEETPEEVESRDERDADAGIRDFYRFEVEAEDGSYAYVGFLARFESSDQADRWLRDAPERLAEDPGPLRDIEQVEALPIGDDSLAFSYRYPLNGDSARGYRILARVGEIVADLHLDALPSAPLEAVETLAEAQIACLESGGCVESIQIPLDPDELEPAPAAVTPETASGFRATHLTDESFEVSLREEPSATAMTVAVLPPGTPVREIGQDVDSDGETWLQVETADGERGWLREVDLQPV